jgi:4-hydroxythreonine-4-phosphate dehydrogenase
MPTRPAADPGHITRLALTVGDPAGIGPEVVLKALAAPDRPRAEVTVYGPVDVLRARARDFGLRPPEELGARLVDVPIEGPIVLGRTSRAGGRAAAEAVLTAARDALAFRIDALVTAPLNKESLHAAGYAWPGHTEMLAEVAGTEDVAMMFVGGTLRVVLVTIHRSLRSVPDAITPSELARVVRLLHRELPRFGAARRRIGVCGLNPHAGEGGLFGREEIDVIAPTLAQLAGEGIEVTGPLPADSLFVRASRGEFDAVVAHYHDQGLIPVKLAAFGHAVNVTLGLPFVRTSVDHGTGFDIVEKGIADGSSLVEAMKGCGRGGRQRTTVHVIARCVSGPSSRVRRRFVRSILRSGSGRLPGEGEGCSHTIAWRSEGDLGSRSRNFLPVVRVHPRTDPGAASRSKCEESHDAADNPVCSFMYVVGGRHIRRSYGQDRGHRGSPDGTSTGF